MSAARLRIGTRASALALAQAHLVAELLGAAQVEIVEIVTSGDRDRAATDKEKWVRELDRALIDGVIDLAVHSAKDIPGQLASGIDLVAALPREDPRDCLVGAESLEHLAPGARVGTSSLRRQGQLLALRPDLRIEPLRGNVDTRLAAITDGALDAAVLAQAGLNRLGRGSEGTALEQLVPAPGQGTIALTARAGDGRAAGAAIELSSPLAMTALRCERAVGIGLGASCATALGAHATILDDERMQVRALITSSDGTRALRDVVEGGIEAPELLGDSVARRLRSAGADDLLDAQR